MNKKFKYGDIIINPFVPQYFNGKPNPLYATVYVGITSKKYYKCISYDGQELTFVPDEKFYSTVNISKEIEELRNTFSEIIFSACNEIKG